MDALFHLVRPSAFYDRPIGERHRMIFYLGHAGRLRLESDCALRAGRSAVPPGVRSPVRLRHRSAAWRIARRPARLIGPPSPRWNATNSARARSSTSSWTKFRSSSCHVAVEHRLMHAETFAYILHQLEYGKKVADRTAASGGPSRARTNGLRPEFIPIPAGPAQLGIPRNGAFGWDNEFRGAYGRRPCLFRRAIQGDQRGVPGIRRAGRRSRRSSGAAIAAGRTLPRNVFRISACRSMRRSTCTQEEATAYAAWRGHAPAHGSGISSRGSRAGAPRAI